MQNMARQGLASCSSSQSFRAPLFKDFVIFKKNSIFRNLGRYMEFKMDYFISLTESNISFSVQLKIQLNFGLSVSRGNSRSQPTIPKFVEYANKLLLQLMYETLIHFMLMVYFYTPWKYQKTSGIERDQWHETAC